MNVKLSKLISVIKKYGFKSTLQKCIVYLKANVVEKVYFLSVIRLMPRKKQLGRELEDILLNKDYSRLIVFRSNFGWNVPLFQRPQHMMRQFARQNCLVLYEVTNFTDCCDTIVKQEENLYLVNYNNIAFGKLVEKYVRKVSKPKYMDIYSTDWRMSVQQEKRYVEDGYHILYEYIDELSPALSGTSELPAAVKEKYDFAINNPEKVTIIVTADILKREVERKINSMKAKIIFAPNAVDYEHFTQVNEGKPLSVEMQSLVQNGRRKVGYYGAVASWFDYNLIKQVASKREDLDFLIFGILYDEAFKKSNINNVKNIHYMGAVPYEDLPIYAKQMDILMIPFVINEITNATSPLKLYEYMALHKPVVTTNMPECRKHKSVLIADGIESFLNQIEKALQLCNDKDYLAILDEEARQNTWQDRVSAILKEIN